MHVTNPRAEARSSQLRDKARIRRVERTFDPSKAEPPKMHCVFCNAEWTIRMESEMYVACEGCPTCGHNRREHKEIRVYCDNCGRLIYLKEWED